MIKTCRSERAS